jgi:DNA-binding transcriptional MerR regulator
MIKMKNTNMNNTLAKEIKVVVIGELLRQLRAVRSECPERDKKVFDWTSESWTNVYTIIEGSIVSYVLSDDEAFEVYVDDDGDKMYEPTGEYEVVTRIINLCIYKEMTIEDAQYFLSNWDTQKQEWLDARKKHLDEKFKEFKARQAETIIFEGLLPVVREVIEELDEAEEDSLSLPVIFPKENPLMIRADLLINASEY